MKQNYHKKVLKKTRPSKLWGEFFTCGKCGHTVTATCLEAHMEKCSPNKKEAICSKCMEKMPVAAFVEHFHSCKGKKPEVKDGA